RAGAGRRAAFVGAPWSGRGVRRLSSLLASVLGWLYSVPQLDGASSTRRVVADLAPWVAALVVAAVVTGIVAAGGMRGITIVQAMQYWLKLTALLVPAVVLLIVMSGREPALEPALAFPVEMGPAGADAYSTGS